MNESCYENFQLCIVTIKLEIPDKVGLNAVAQFCCSIVTTNFKDFLLITLSLQILSTALRLQTNLLLYSMKNNITKILRFSGKM
jgi:hypothetical protein